MTLRLVVVEGPDTGLRFEVAEDAVVGRDPTAAVQLNDEAVSRRHAIVSVAGDEAVVEDLGSSNGTWIGDERVEGTAPLAVGARLRVGATVLELHEGPGGDDQPSPSPEAADPPPTKVPLPDWREAGPPSPRRFAVCESFAGPTPFDTEAAVWGGRLALDTGADT